MSKQLLLALGAGGAVTAAVVASAATLGTVNSTDLGAGVNVVASCDDDDISVDYTTEYSSDTGSYTVASVTLSDVDVACAGQSIDVTLADDGNADLGTASGTMPASPATTVTLTVSATSPLTDVEAEDVENVAVVISG
ncbi:hypothetical protein GCM10009795_041660 [Nocardioides hankookensis]|uniref:Uncharacterized protein n=1 Tax=Nocardioides hankookensis TaxID=443157 RepID=A0ABW1LQW6_9ACTN